MVGGALVWKKNTSKASKSLSQIVFLQQQEKHVHENEVLVSQGHHTQITINYLYYL